MIPRPEILDGLEPALGLYLAFAAAVLAVGGYYVVQFLRGPRPRP